LIREKESQSVKAVEEVQAKLKTLSSDKAAKEADLKQSQKELGALAKQTQDAQAKLNDCLQKGAKIYEALSQSRAKADEAKASLSASQSQSQVLTSLNRLRDSGRVQGFHVRSGDDDSDNRVDLEILARLTPNMMSLSLLLVLN